MDMPYKLELLVKDYDIYKTLECGQCFRHLLISIDPLTYRVIASDKVCIISQPSPDTINLQLQSEEDRDFWLHYFNFAADYTPVADIVANNAFLKSAEYHGRGIKLLRQSPWETFISFIISQNNNIPRIKKSVEALCKLAGKPIAEHVYAFPTLEELYNKKDSLSECGLGYREAAIRNAIVRIKEECPAFEVTLRQCVARGDINQYLQSFMGVGPKVAACIMLFGLQIQNQFPRDTWIQRGVEAGNISEEEIRSFGEYSGIIQQYIYWKTRNSL